MKRAAEWIADIILVLAFAASSIVSGLDLLGVLDLSALWGGSALPQMVKVSLLLVGLLGSVLVFERRFLLSKMARETDTISKDTGEVRKDARHILEVLQNIQQARSPTRIYKTREETYLAFSEALKAAPIGSHVYVTHFEKYRGASYDIGEIEAETELMEQWVQRVLRGDFFVRQIVHVCSIFDLGEVEDRIKRFEDASNYSLNTMYGPPIRPYLDLVIIRGQWAMLHLSANPMSPFEADIGFVFSDIEMVNAFERYFDIWWSRFSVPVKDRDGRKPESISLLRDLLPSQAAEAWLDQSFELSLRLARDKELYEMFNDIAIEFANIQQIPVSDVFKETANSLIRECRDKIRSISSTSIKLEPIEGTLVLVRIFDEAKERVIAVSHDPHQEKFWESSLGRRILRANADAIKRGVKITRVFILTPEQNRRSVSAVIQQHIDTGIEVLVAKADELPPELLADYLIQDDRLVFHIEVSKKGGLPGKSWVSIDRHEVSNRQRLFNLLRLRSVRPEELLDHLEA